MNPPRFAGPATRTLHILVLIAFASAVLSIPCPLLAQTPPPKSTTPGAPNLIATFTSAGKSDARLSRLPDLFIESGHSPAPFLPPGPFKVTFTGDLSLRIRDTLKFTFAGRGTVKLSINGKPVLENSGDDLSNKTSDDVKLLKGKNAFQLEYTSPDSGNAELRTYWLSKDFAAEPIPPTQFSHDPNDAVFAEHAKLHDGRALFATHRCIKCHTSDELSAAAGAMPELSIDAPNLSEAGARLNPAWIAAWIENPKSIRPTATMPRVFTSAQGKQDIQDIAAYLATLGQPDDAKIPADDQTVGNGGHLFTALGCIACHLAPDSKVDDPTRIPLSIDKLKYRPAALKAFLLSPEKNYASIRMPNFRLADAEAAALTAYLLAKGPEPLPPITGDAAHGQQLFVTAGCLNCHTVANLRSPAPPAGRALADIQKSPANGCLAVDDAGRNKAPDFGFTPDDRAAITTVLKTDLASLKQDDPQDLAERQVAALNCLACHIRDKAGDPWAGLVDEVQSIEQSLPPQPEDPNSEKYAPDQSRPNLNWVGEKLYPEWMEQFIGGKMDFKPRPYLHARMPGFVNRAKFIAPGFAAEHGYPAKSSPPAPPDPSLIPIGQKLAGKSGGFGCNSCHAIGSAAALAAFEAPAPNYAYVKERIRKDYYTRWVRNPQRVEPGTRMPSFADYEGKTAIKDPYDGDSKQQFEAIWNYLQTGRQIAPPG